MIKYILKKSLRLIMGFAILFVGVCYVASLLPGDSVILNECTTVEEVAQVRLHHRLGEVDWGRYLRGDFGASLAYPDRSVGSIVREGAGISLRLGFQAFLVVVLCGMGLGILAACSHTKITSVVIDLCATLPALVVVIGIQSVFALHLNWFPIARWGGWETTVLPTMTLALVPTAVVARFVRIQLQQVLAAPYIVTARAKGLTEFQTVMRHALPNAVPWVWRALAPMITHLMMGSFVVEKVFGIPGLGYSFVMSILQRDYQVIVALSLVYGSLLLIVTQLLGSRRETS